MIRLSTRGRYGTRALLELAGNYGETPLSTREIALRQELPIKYLEQIFIVLKKAKIVDSTRGSTGGFVLAVAPEHLTLLMAIEVLEGPFSFVQCTSDESYCDRTDSCALHDVWKDFCGEAHKFFGSITFADLVNRNKRKKDPFLQLNTYRKTA